MEVDLSEKYYELNRIERLDESNVEKLDNLRENMLSYSIERNVKEKKSY